MMNAMAAWILAQNEEVHDVARSPELALLAGFSLDHVLASAAGRDIVAIDDAPPSSGAATVRPARA